MTYLLKSSSIFQITGLDQTVIPVPCSVRPYYRISLSITTTTTITITTLYFTVLYLVSLPSLLLCSNTRIKKVLSIYLCITVLSRPWGLFSKATV
jgi:hypothetical protein